MIVIRTLNGRNITADENAVILVAGRYPHDVGPHTYVHGVTPAVLLTAERPDSLVNRLRVKPPLAKLTRPDLTPVWVKGSAVTLVRAPLPTEQQAPGEVKAEIEVGPHHQSVHEDVPTAREIVNAHGGNI